MLDWLFKVNEVQS